LAAIDSSKVERLLIPQPRGWGKPAADVGQVLQHFRDVGWRGTISCSLGAIVTLGHQSNALPGCDDLGYIGIGLVPDLEKLAKFVPGSVAITPLIEC